MIQSEMVRREVGPIAMNLRILIPTTLMTALDIFHHPSLRVIHVRIKNLESVNSIAKTRRIRKHLIPEFKHRIIEKKRSKKTTLLPFLTEIAPPTQGQSERLSI